MKTLTTVTWVFFVLILANGLSTGQTAKGKPLPVENLLPPVFLLGEYDKQYEAITPNYQTLLEANDGDMQVAFGKLMGMMREMEAYAGLVGYDIKGVNAWMHFFWKADGSIEHIGFHLKPNSRNVDTDDLKAFLAGFAKQYRFPLRSGKKYAHYSSFSFPLTFLSTKPLKETDKSTARTGH